MAKAYLCEGKDCRKRAKDTEALREIFEEAGLRCERVRCQKICNAPVVGLKIDGTMQWFAKVRGKSGRKALRRFLRTGDGPLRKLRSKKRSGKLR
jgi:hypothetical protein